MRNNSPEKIVHLITPYLFYTGSWVYSQLIGVKKFSNIVFTQRKENLQLFPFQEVFSPEDFGYFKKVTNKIYRRITDNYGLYFNKITRSINPRLFHAHFGFEAARWLAFVKKSGIPLITTFYGLDVSQFGKLDEWKQRYKILFDYGTTFLAEGTFLKKQLVELGCPADKVIIQHLGVPVAKYPSKQHEKKSNHSHTVILQVSSFREKKGIEYSLEAIAQVVKVAPNIEFRLIGRGDSVQADRAISSIIERLGIAPYVKLLGGRSHQETIQEMFEADIFLHPSVTASNGDNEGGAPVSVIEASAVGLPVVSTIHADIPEVVRNGKTGWLVPERNSNLLAEKLLELINLPEQRKSFGRLGREYVSSEYDLSIQIRKLEEIYSQVTH
jgi:colanic acid/amylovoran biosynthesis glycosyltransferase